jgi:predicted alpha/beta superfamily hydrolase
MKAALTISALALFAACPAPGSRGDDDVGDDDAAPDASTPDPDPDAGEDDLACAAGSAGTACVLALHDRVATTCVAAEVTALTTALESRRGTWPLWHQGRALFVSDAPAQIAGAFNDWRSDADATTPLCASGLSTAIVAIESGRWPYKLVASGTWMLDPGNWAFVFDDYEGNADGRNSVINTYDSSLGHLVRPPDTVCSAELENCRTLTAYLPRGYADPANADRRYPVVFMHDGQNVFDDHDCCFGHTGWEVNVQLDGDIEAGHIEETIVVAADHAGAARNDEYGWSTAAGGKQETFMAFQVTTVQPTAAAHWRLDEQRYYVAGSSLGGLISMRLALAYPDVYAGAASLSGAFWPGQDTETALRDVLAETGKVAVPLYLDHGGTAEEGGDGYADSIEIRDQLASLGWSRTDSPDCASGSPGPDALCYFHDVGATHDELAWKARAWRFLRFFVGR